jgi:hypothetical protein
MAGHTPALEVPHERLPLSALVLRRHRCSCRPGVATDRQSLCAARAGRSGLQRGAAVATAARTQPTICVHVRSGVMSV